MKKLIILSLLFQLVVTTAFAQQYKYHIVEKGETVYSIAEKYNISREIIFKYNPDARAGINVDSKLVVPLNPEFEMGENLEFEEHKVKRKETLFSLSQEYGVSIDVIKRFNKHLYSEELERGERIRIPVNFQQPTEEKFVEQEEQNPLNLSIKEHVVLPKENKFQISRRYNITIEELDRLNPGVDVLQPGMVLRISNGNTEKIVEVEGGLFKYYQVKPQETFYSLTQRLGISRDSLEVLNPALQEGLKAGMVLKIPNLGSDEELIPYSEETLLRLEARINNYDPKDLVVMLPFGLDKIETTDSTSNAAERIAKDRVLQISLDFYSGVMMALDSAKAMGLTTNVRFFDTKQNTYEVTNIISNNSFSGVDAVIGPLLQSTAEAAAARLRAEGIPVISPITKRETRNMDNFVQARPTDKMLEDAMIAYMADNAAGKNIVIIADPSAIDIKRRLFSSFPNSRTVSIQEGSYIQPRDLSAALVSDRPNWVILESDKIGVITSATSQLNSLADRSDITLLTTNRNNSFESDNVSNLHLARLKFHFPSVDKEYEGLENVFIASYFKKYAAVPNTYVVRGFDVTLDVLLRLASAEDLVASMEEEGTTQYVENKFDYEKMPSGGYVNTAIYIMAYDENMKLKVVR